MKWTAPPDRREITLILFSLTIFVFAYNLESTLQLLGVDPDASRTVLFNRIILGNTKVLGKDGRKPPAWRDPLERLIWGDWAWDEGHVAGDGAERTQTKGGQGIHVAGEPFGERGSVNQGIRNWNENFPVTKVVKHAKGFSVLDNVVIFNGSVYLVAEENDLESFPPVSDIVSTISNGFGKWELITQAEAYSLMGGYGGIIPEVSWMSADDTWHNSTLFSLWRTYSSLDSEIDEEGKTMLPPPRRLIFPHNRFFTDANPDFSDHWIRRARVNTGFHPYTQKAILPTLSVLYFEDWDDYHLIEVPFVFERLVVSDRGAGMKSELVSQWQQPVWSPPFELDGSKWWWEPIRRSLETFLELGASTTVNKVVTYIDTQNDFYAPKLRKEDHAGYDVRVVSNQADYTPWRERMQSMVESTVVVSAYGGHLFDALFMRPASQSSVIEIFPEDVFMRDRWLAATSIGINYIGLTQSKKFTQDEEFPPARMAGHNGPIPIGVDTVIQTIHEVLRR
ncbi:hypothetical protein BDQ17DRAFT_1397480 [Cyathus striatus]|nr:hypothetical protein BDQ17DRAFT_1397480 [Cyathus striatus]